MLASRPPGHDKRLSHYHFGRTTLFASRVDQRFSYCLYIPSSYQEEDERRYPLAVIVHGTNRPAQAYRDAFADFGEEHGCVIMAPLFPAGIIEPGELSGYKFITYHDIRFDHVLLGMVDEVAETWRLEAGRFLMHGFSGGAHFAHRFFYLHPERLLGVSIGAPGAVTLLDAERDWWVGVRNLKEVFGQGLDLEAMRSVPVQMVIGADDTETWEITIKPDSRLWMDGANDAGRTRLDRLASLRASFERAGIAVRYDVAPGVGHEGFKLLDPVKDFFARALAAKDSVGARRAP